MPHTTAGKNNMLAALGVTHVSLHSGFPGNAGLNELAGGAPAYARQAVVFAAAGGGARAQTGSAAFDVPAASTVRYVGFWTALAAGACVSYHPIGGQPAREFVADLAAELIRCPAHGYANADTIVFCGDTPPAGLVEGTVYFVIGSAADSFQVSATSGGAAIDLTAQAGSACQVIKIIPEIFASQGTATVTGCSLNLLL